MTVSQSQPSPALRGAGTASEPSASKRLGYEAEQRILAYLRDGDVDKHDSLHSDVQRLYQEMLTWRIACQRWTPGGSEFMDPAFCCEFILRERRRSVLDRVELAKLRRATASPEGLGVPQDEPTLPQPSGRAT